MTYSIYEVVTGNILRTVSCPPGSISLQCGEGEDFIPGQYCDERHCVIDGSVIDRVVEPVVIPPEDYRLSRRKEYPPLGDQLDVLWKELAQAPGRTLAPETSAMLAQIAAVKTKYPKTSPQKE